VESKACPEAFRSAPRRCGVALEAGNDRSCSRLAWSLQEAVIAVLHLMQHLLLRGLVHRVQHGDLMHEQVPLAL